LRRPRLETQNLSQSQKKLFFGKGPACQLNKKQHAHKATTTFLVVEEEQKKRQTLLREQEKSITYHIQHHHHLLSFIFYIKSALSLSQRLHPSYYHLE
jgi:CRISPR/Cas system CMR subunit Cmr6 (Cas7 group RAMP superfamily)